MHVSATFCSAVLLLPSPRTPSIRPAAPPLPSRPSIPHKNQINKTPALSENLKPGKPLGVDILGTRVVLFRDEETGKVGFCFGWLPVGRVWVGLGWSGWIDWLLVWLPSNEFSTKTKPTNPSKPQITCLDDACPHRGAPLSSGWLTTLPPSGADAAAPSAASAGSKKGAGCSSGKGAAADSSADGEGKGSTCVVCPYHGWAFDGKGKLRDVPSADEGTWPKRPLVGSYSVGLWFLLVVAVCSSLGLGWGWDGGDGT